ncbi:recombinase family protein [Tissierella sp.]|uniref:recombinase family protein n=1 Tax=Tissierella sp. TaxID=41274 RepID=UPI0028672BA9|nr:recombinase family protein [Tissierella sp.]MDR7855002.1 recombinase family protein [Tissierella sp.]
MRKIAVYTRVSSARQASDDAYSLEVQKERCIYLLKSKGYAEEDIVYYTDAGISGTTIAERDELKELLDALEHGELDGICCYDLSRISRSISHTMEIFRLLKENQLRLYTCDGAFDGDINGQNAKIMVSIYSMLNELFIDQLRERVLDGMTKSVEAGNYFGGPAPMGYQYEYYSTKQEGKILETQDTKTKKKDIKKRLIINEEEKPVVELIFDLFTNQKHSIRGVAQYLNTRGYKTRRGAQFATATVQKILENPVYAGRLFWGKRRQKKKTDEGVRVWEKITVYDINFYDLPEGNHPKIVDEEFFLETIARLNSRRQIRKNQNTAQAMRNITKETYDDMHKKMFINILHCPNCNGKMTSSKQPGHRRADGTKSESKVYYKCSTYNSGKNHCDGYYSVQEERAFNLIKEDFFNRLKQAFVLVKEYQNYLAEKFGTKERMMFDEEIEKIKKEIQLLERNRNKLTSKLDLMIGRQLDTDVDSVKYIRFEKMIKDTEQEITKVQEIIAEQQKKIKQAEKRRDALLQETQEQEQFSTMEEYFNSLSLLQKRGLLEKVYSKIVIDTISNAKRGPKKISLKEMEYNQYSSVSGLCKVLGVQDFNEFNNYLKASGKHELTLIQQHFGDEEEYMKEIEKSNININPKVRKYIRDLDEQVAEKHDEFLVQFMASIEDDMETMTYEEFEERYDDASRKYKNDKFIKNLKKHLHDNCEKIFSDMNATELTLV